MTYCSIPGSVNWAVAFEFKERSLVLLWTIQISIGQLTRYSELTRFSERRYLL
jgi:hypothetical protein